MLYHKAVYCEGQKVEKVTTASTKSIKTAASNGPIGQMRQHFRQKNWNNMT